MGKWLDYQHSGIRYVYHVSMAEAMLEGKDASHDMTIRGLKEANVELFGLLDDQGRCDDHSYLA